MKKCIISAIAGALGMLLLLYGIAAVKVSQEEKEYEHIDFVSELPQEDCFLCGSGSDLIVSSHWGEDNVGIINLNTFELLHLEINRYDDDGKLIEEEAGFMQASHLIGDDICNFSFFHFGFLLRFTFKFVQYPYCTQSSNKFAASHSRKSTFSFH